MANVKKAIKISQKHLLGIQDLSISDVNFILSESSKVSFVNINLDVPIGVGFDESINFGLTTERIISTLDFGLIS